MGGHIAGCPSRVPLRELDRMHLVTLAISEGRVAKRSLTTPGQRRTFAAMELPEPPAFADSEVTATPHRGPPPSGSL